MSQLPIDEVLTPLLDKLGSSSQLILKAPPGAGKSTRLPLVLLQQKVVPGRIVMLEPRRLAARNIATYLARQLGEKVGETIGLRVRGETLISRQTRLEIVTEGVMTRMLQQDPELDGIDLLIFDEFHERSIHADTALALALEVQEALRDDLKLLVMSATLDEAALCSLLPAAGYLESAGRCFPVAYRYQRLTDNSHWLDEAAKAILRLLAQEPGSMLVFLPGAGEIRRLTEQLAHSLAIQAGSVEEVELCPLYGQLSPAQQQQAISPAPPGKRKVVLATNIAETSLTIEGIRLVVDAGLERIARWDPKTGICRLESVRIARSSAEQRAGRAGRLEPGICLRLYSEELLARQPATPQPEILRADLTALAMELAQWGCQSATELRWLDVPPDPALQQSRRLLTLLGALDERGQLTDTGQAIQALGADPRHAAILVMARDQGHEAMATAAMLVALLEDPPRGMDNPDLHFQLNLMENGKLPRSQAYLQRARQHLAKLGAQNVPLLAAGTWLAPLMAAGFPDRIALSRGRDSRYQLANGQGAMLLPDEPLADNELLVVADIVKTRQGDSRIFSAVAAELHALRDALPHLFAEREWLDWDDRKGRLTAEKQLCCGKLVLSRQLMGEPDPAKASEALLNAVVRKGLAVLPWSDKAVNLLERARCAAEWLPELALPAMDDDSLLADAADWLLPYMNGMTSLKALEKLDVLAALEARLGWDKAQALDAALPTHYQVPTGSRYAIRYQQGQHPVLAVKLQEMFGEKSSPLIANGKVALVLELLSPAQRPLQITRDLAAFWQGSYREVQKEMKGRYPKHPWPDDPANHAPTRKTKKYM
ncbi:ATP-dependent helicase HrpB [Photobacterium ganghwense]|uniref:ATP-dependent helicase HrpB n=1 Tax=Photobacterium ganghwense TaxID=320778 RepID=A0A0J1JVI6_9GAMM|nr:ATP-dependent helicase HrpB [Photobacterium ganghwense]KLV06307.1 ATP-dependent helicase HrpB [Photobacterium ganghwense]PSU06671.1 ATP-dependent helicase HrpB [Photobacterium ganghwense]